MCVRIYQKWSKCPPTSSDIGFMSFFHQEKVRTRVCLEERLFAEYSVRQLVTYRGSGLDLIERVRGDVYPSETAGGRQEARSRIVLCPLLKECDRIPPAVSYRWGGGGFQDCSCRRRPGAHADDRP